MSHCEHVYGEVELREEKLPDVPLALLLLPAPSIPDEVLLFPLTVNMSCFLKHTTTL